MNQPLTSPQKKAGSGSKRFPQSYSHFLRSYSRSVYMNVKKNELIMFIILFMN